MSKAKTACRMLLFGLIAAILFAGANYMFQPVWYDWNNYDTTHGFYEQPKNTIETIFLGASITCNGITPMELYEDYGICAWNLGTEQQPVLASYYWLEEAYRRHPETLKTVFLDTSLMRRVPETAFYRKAIDSMRFSKAKIMAVKDYTTGVQDFISYLIPLFSYHDRWNALTKTDFVKQNYETNESVRGYNFTTENVLQVRSYNKMSTPVYTVSEEVKPAKLNGQARHYFAKMVDFCKEKGIRLVLMRTPVVGKWGSDRHNAIQKLADENNLEFLDFNFNPYFEEIDYNSASDSRDMSHMNYYGAKKLTNWLGKYMVEQCNATDVRGDAKYAFMEEQLSDYHRNIVSVGLNRIENPAEYLLTLTEKQDYTIFITAKASAGKALTPEQREQFAALGLEKLSGLSENRSYLAVLGNGNVLHEEAGEEPVFYNGALPGNVKYAMSSAGSSEGQVSSCVIDEVEYSPNGQGLNIIVYDNQRHKVMDSAVFDTCTAPLRKAPDVELARERAEAEGVTLEQLEGDEKSIYLYNRKCGIAKARDTIRHTIGEEDFDKYLELFWQDENTTVFLSAMEMEDSYLSVRRGGEVVSEKKSQGAEPVTENGDWYSLTSGGLESGSVSSIIIDGAEYSPQKKGINVVAYDNILGTIIDARTFEVQEVEK